MLCNPSHLVPFVCLFDPFYFIRLPSVKHCILALLCFQFRFCKSFPFREMFVFLFLSHSTHTKEHLFWGILLYRPTVPVLVARPVITLHPGRLRVYCASPLPGPVLTTGAGQTAGMWLLHTGHQLPSVCRWETPLLIECCSLNSYRSFTM